MLADALASGKFVVTAELGPPAEPDPEPVREAARALAGVVDAANVTDNQAATVKLSPLACSAWMLEEGLEPILQLTARDRNLMALQSDLLAAWALGVGTVLALSGDPLNVGPYEGRATAVSDVDSVGLAALIAGLNAGRLAAGEKLETPTGFLVASAANPFVDSIDRLERKLDAGVGCLQTNIVYDVERFAEWFAPVVAAGVAERASVLVGVMPPRSSRALEYIARDHPLCPRRRGDVRAHGRPPWRGGEGGGCGDRRRRHPQRARAAGRGRRSHHGAGLAGRGGAARGGGGRVSATTA